MRHLLNHTGGWDGDVLLVKPVGGRNDSALSELPPYMETVVEELTPPGELFHYNNTGFSLAGRVIEVVSGRSYEDFVTEEIFAPLGMKESFFFPEDCLTHAVAVGHSLAGEVEDGWCLPRSSFPAGQISASAADMITYGRYWLGDGVPLLSSPAMTAMLTPTVAVGGALNSEACGLGWFLSGAEGEGRSGLVITHGGSTNGQFSGFSVHRGAGSPATALVVSVMTNGARGRVLCTELEAWIVDRLLGPAASSPVTLEPPLEFALSEYAGVYYNSRSLSMVTVTADEESGTLTLVAAPNSNIPGWQTADAGADDEEGDPTDTEPAYPSPKVVRMLAHDKAELGVQFIRSEGGEVEWLRDMRLLRRHAPQARL